MKCDFNFLDFNETAGQFSIFFYNPRQLTWPFAESIYGWSHNFLIFMDWPGIFPIGTTVSTLGFEASDEVGILIHMATIDPVWAVKIYLKEASTSTYKHEGEWTIYACRLGLKKKKKSCIQITLDSIWAVQTYSTFQF